MIVYPAIDLLGGRVVRLSQGDAARATTYAVDPEAVAEGFVRAGARMIHVVDLSGAFAGAPVQRASLDRIAARVHAAGGAVQLSGGLRSRAAAQQALDAGADRIVLGTLAVEDPAAVWDLCARFPGRIVVAVDARDGRIATHGWTVATAQTAESLARAAAAHGAAAILYTDIARDGTGRGPAVARTAALQRAVPIPVIASGGVRSADDLAALARAGVQAAVVGRALYEGTLTVERALAAC